MLIFLKSQLQVFELLALLDLRVEGFLFRLTLSYTTFLSPHVAVTAGDPLKERERELHEIHA